MIARSVVSKIMWVARVTVFLVGLIGVLALAFKVASVTFGANGDFFNCPRNHGLSQGY